MSPRWSVWAVPRRTATAACRALVIGCASVFLVSQAGHAQQNPSQQDPSRQSAPQTFDSRDSQLFYELLVAELALRRGELEVAAEGYLSATRRTDDPRVAERATQLAVYYQDWPRAESVARRWLSLDPESLGAYQTLAQIYLRQGDEVGAVESFSGWVRSSDNSDAAFQAINAQLAREGQPQLAFDVATQLAGKFPDEPRAQLGAAGMALAAGDWEAALKAVDEALTLDPEFVDALLLKAQIQIVQGQSPAALETLQSAVDAQPDSLPLHLGFGQLLVDSELYDRAGPILERAGELSEGDADTWLRLGLLSLRAIRYDQAKVFLDGVLVDDPLNERANLYLGRIADTRHDNDAAIAYFDAVPQGDFFVTARLRAAELTAESGAIDDALERLRELGPLAQTTDMKVELIASEGRILQQADRGEEAIEILSRGLDTYPGNTSLLYSRALTGEQNGRDTLLEKDLATILALEPNNAHALNALGYHLVVNNTRLEEAAEYLERASALEPDDAAIMDSLGWLRYRQGKLAEARELLTQAYAIFPDAEIAAHLGEVLWVMGDETAAQELWDKALADEPDHEVLNAVIHRFVQK